MIFDVCLSPRVFDPALNGNTAQYYALAISLLRDFEENCVILVDSDEARVTTTAIRESVGGWPIKYRIPAKEVLSRLLARRRFVAVQDYSVAPSCGLMPCRHVVGIASTGRADALLISDNCETTARTVVDPAAVIPFSEYPLSRFATERRSATSKLLRSGLTQTEAERGVLARVFRHATHITIVDRYIGRAVAGRDRSQASFGRDYQRSLEWIVEVCRQALAAGNRELKGSIEIWCGLDIESLSQADIDASVGLLRQWETQMNASGAPRLRLYIKKETHKGVLPHARYLITDQIAVLVDRGFELLLSDSQMRVAGLDPRCDERRLRDCVVALTPDVASTMREIRHLPDL
jgi:hypothetical protein